MKIIDHDVTIIAQVEPEVPTLREGTALLDEGTVMLVVLVVVGGTTGTGTEEIEDLIRAMGRPESRSLFFFGFD